MSAPTNGNGGISRSNSKTNLTPQPKTDSVTIKVTEETPLFPKSEMQEPTNTAKACNYVTTFVVTTVITAGIVYSAYYNPYETAGFLFGGGLVAWCCCCVRPNPSTGFYSDSIR